MNPLDVQDERVAAVKGALTREWQTCAQIARGCGMKHTRMSWYLSRMLDRHEVEYKREKDVPYYRLPQVDTPTP